MSGLLGPDAQGGGPGSIWRIDGATGAVSLFANVTPDGAPNNGPALGGLAFDPSSSTLFVADRQTGMIHRFNLSAKKSRDTIMAYKAVRPPVCRRPRTTRAAPFRSQATSSARQAGHVGLRRTAKARVWSRGTQQPALLRDRRPASGLVGRP